MQTAVWVSPTTRLVRGAETTARIVASAPRRGDGAALEAFRPFLSYTDIGRLLVGRPSEMYDALASILGLEQITAAVGRLAAAQKTLKTQRDVATAEAKGLVTFGATVSDARATRVVGQLKAFGADLDAVERAVTGTDGEVADDDSARLRSLLATQPPVAEDVLVRAGELQAANEELGAFDGTDAERAGLLADLLTQAIRHQGVHGDVPCPVCGGRELDRAWRDSVERQVATLRETASALRNAQAHQKQAYDSLRIGISAVPTALSGPEDLGLSTLPAARDAWQALHALPPDLRLVADHVAAHVAPLAAIWPALVSEIEESLRAREDVWRPFAVEVAAWLPEARAVRGSAAALTAVTAAIAWLKAAADALRSERLQPLADQSARSGGFSVRRATSTSGRSASRARRQGVDSPSTSRWTAQTARPRPGPRQPCDGPSGRRVHP